MRIEKNKKGFTLIELMVVVVIIAILAGLLMVAIFRVQATVTEQLTTSTLNMVRDAIIDYKAGTGMFPISDQVARGGNVTAGDGHWVYNLQAQGPANPYIKDGSGDVVQLDPDNEVGTIFDSWGMPINFRVVGADGGSNNPMATLVEYLKVGSKLKVFYVWSNGTNQEDEFTDGYELHSGSTWDLDLSTAANWQNFELLDDATWMEYTEDDVIVSGMAK